MAKFIPPDPLLWLLMRQEDVLNSFANVTGAYSDGKDQNRFVFIPGTRKDRVLLVAHSDTVFGDSQVKIGFHDGIFYSKNRWIQGKDNWSGTGIGADDRAGCAIVWELMRLGHSVLITSGEERGGIAASYIMQDSYWKDLIASHNFAVEFDRQGKSDAVFYECGTDEFIKHVTESMKFKEKQGSFTDIRILCKKICGVNLSVGYYNQHTPGEILNYSQWMRTLYRAHEWLKKPTERFELVYKKKEIQMSHSDHEGERDMEIEAIMSDLRKSSETINCMNCGKPTPKELMFRNYFHCDKCDVALCMG